MRPAGGLLAMIAGLLAASIYPDARSMPRSVGVWREVRRSGARRPGWHSLERMVVAEMKRERKNAKRLRDWTGGRVEVCGRRFVGESSCSMPKGHRCPDCSSVGIDAGDPS